MIVQSGHIVPKLICGVPSWTQWMLLEFLELQTPDMKWKCQYSTFTGTHKKIKTKCRIEMDAVGAISPDGESVMVTGKLQASGRVPERVQKAVDYLNVINAWLYLRYDENSFWADLPDGMYRDGEPLIIDVQLHRYCEFPGRTGEWLWHVVSKRPWKGSFIWHDQNIHEFVIWAFSLGYTPIVFWPTASCWERILAYESLNPKYDALKTYWKMRYDEGTITIVESQDSQLPLTIQDYVTLERAELNYQPFKRPSSA